MYYSLQGGMFKGPPPCYLEIELSEGDHPRIVSMFMVDEGGKRMLNITSAWRGARVPPLWWPVQLGDPDLRMDEGL
jgi:hypothetical protein